MSKPKILAQGVGSIGGFIAGCLAENDCDITLLTGNEKITRAISENGLTIANDDMEATVRPPVYTHIEDIPGEDGFDIVLLGMMAQKVVAACQESSKRLNTDGYFVTYQNGIVLDAVADVCTPARLIPSTLAFGATMEAPGKCRQTTNGRIMIGELDGRETQRVEQLKNILGLAVETTISPNMLGVLWGKLSWNSAVSALCAISGHYLGQICSDELTQRLLLLSFREVIDTARASNVQLERVVVDHTKLYVSPNASEAELNIAKGVLAPLETRYAAVQPSTLQSLLRGRTTEIDYLNGYVVSVAEKLGREAPLNRALTDFVKAIERKEQKIDPANLEMLSGFADQLLTS